MVNTFSLISLGCIRNSYDSEIIIQKFINQGFVFKENWQYLDYLIINTCGFIKEAKEEALEHIEKAIELKKQGRVKKIVVLGCLVERYKNELRKLLNEVDSWQGIEKVNNFKPRRRILPPFIDYLKISEGCLNKCSYCSIPIIRGDLKSRRLKDIINEAKIIDKRKVKELNIIAQDVTSWGKDIYKNKDFLYLLKRILKETRNIPWIRILYTHPRHFNKELIELIAREDRVCKYIDLPIQHINDRILKLMRRKISRKEIERLISQIRKTIPEAVIRTSLIVGFPTEREEEFEELLDFIKRVQFQRLGAFIYSREENTPAFYLQPQIHYKTKQRRYNKLMSIQQEISRECNKELIGKKLKVLIENKEGELFIGRTQFHTYEVDGVVYIKAHHLKIGEFLDVEITDSYEYDLLARPL